MDASTDKAAAPLRYFDHADPLIIAHRGGGALAPENTLAAFKNAIALGADAIEMDIQMTSDHEIVVMHDHSINRTTDGKGSVSQFTLADLRQFDAGYRFSPDHGHTFPFRGNGEEIPPLRAIFEQFPHVRLNIGLKVGDPELEQRLWALIQEYEAEERVLLGCGATAPLEHMRQLSHGRVATAASAREAIAFLLQKKSGYQQHGSRYQALQVPERLGMLRFVTPKAIMAAHTLGLPVHIWTVNEKKAIERLLDWKVDGIMTDRPNMMSEVLRTKKLSGEQ